LIAVAMGILIGHFFPDAGNHLKPLGDGFIKLIKTLIGPIIFCTIVHGIASMSDLKKLGRVGIKMLLYFEVVSTVALLVGIDRFMSECRALTNMIGNGVATVVISRWENELTKEQLTANLAAGKT
jgi:Na+/H+-dicarboxylate symporter